MIKYIQPQPTHGKEGEFIYIFDIRYSLSFPYTYTCLIIIRNN